MSVMVINEGQLSRVGKFLSLSMTDEKALELTLQWHKLNLKNFAERYKEHGEYYDGPEVNPHEWSLSEVAIPASVQAVSDMEALYYNCIDYGRDIDEEALEQLYKAIERVKSSKEYQLTEHLESQVKYF